MIELRYCKDSIVKKQVAEKNISAPYILKVGNDWTPQFPYENPEHFITFKWFKINIICAEQHWICGSEARKTTWWKNIFSRGQPSFDHL